MHTPVLLQKVANGLDIKPGGLYIDATFGEGGHSLEIIKRGGKVLGIEADQEQILNFKFSILNLKLVQGNFKDIEKIAKEHGFFPLDGIIFDLGLSMGQINNSSKGFSYQRLEEPLDMRLDSNQELTAEKIINSFNQDELYEILATYSEELNSRNVARGIVVARSMKKIQRVKDLLKVIDQAVGKKDKKVYARIFQGLRIAVNNELENLKRGLLGSLKILNKKGRIVIISFHSLEDRIIKKFIKENRLLQLNKKIIVGDRNLKFERSAKMRIISF